MDRWVCRSLRTSGTARFLLPERTRTPRKRAAKRRYPRHNFLVGIATNKLIQCVLTPPSLVITSQMLAQARCPGTTPRVVIMPHPQMYRGLIIAMAAPPLPRASLVRQLCHWTAAQATPALWRPRAWQGCSAPRLSPLHWSCGRGVS